MSYDISIIPCASQIGDVDPFEYLEEMGSRYENGDVAGVPQLIAQGEIDRILAERGHSQQGADIYIEAFEELGYISTGIGYPNSRSEAEIELRAVYEVAHLFAERFNGRIVDHQLGLCVTLDDLPDAVDRACGVRTFLNEDAIAHRRPWWKFW